MQWCDVGTDAGTVRVRQAFVEQRGTELIVGPPKSRAGIPAVAIPSAVLPALRTTCGTPATPWRLGRLVRACAISWPGWATTVHGPAPIHQHTNSEADRGIADALSEAVDEHHRKALRASGGLPAQSYHELPVAN